MSSNNTVDFFSTGVNGAGIQREHSVDSVDILDDGDGTGFAAQLRKHRKQVLDKDAAPSDFKNILRRHRDHLVDAWEDHHVEQNTPKNDANDVVNNVENKGQNGSAGFGAGLTFDSKERFGDEGNGFSLPAIIAPEPNRADSTDDNNDDTNADDDDDDDFGSFDKAPTHTEMDGQSSCDDDELGKRTDTTSQDETPVEAGVHVDDVTDFKKIGSVKESDQNNVTSGNYGDIQSKSEPCKESNRKDGTKDYELSQTPEIERTAGINGGNDVASREYLSTQQIVDNGVDDFGSFDQAQLPKGKTFMGTSIGDHDSNGADKNPQNVDTNANKSGYGNEEIDNDFGDFGAAPALSAQSVEKGIIKDDASSDFEATLDLLPQLASGDVVEDDAFGDFGAAPSTSEPLNATSGDKDTDDDGGDDNDGDNYDDDGFGDFNVAPTVVSRSVDGNGGEDGAFDTFDAAPSKSEPLNETSGDKDTNDDDFGDFDAARAIAPQLLEDKVGEDNEYGDFGATPSIPEPLIDTSGDNEEEDPAMATQLKDGNGDIDDAFGDFDVAPLQSEFLNNSSEENDSKVSKFDAVVSDNPEGNIVDDFGAATSQPELSTGSTEHKVENSDGNFGAATTLSEDADDSFGDFDAAPSQPELSNSLSMDKNGNEDFGTAPAKSDDDEDDAFCDFNVAPSSLSEPLKNASKDKDSEEDGSFGDFDASLSSQPEPLDGTSENKDDEEDDSFVDLDVAPSQSEPFQNPSEDDDSFGDFDATPSSQSEPLDGTSEDKDDNAFDDLDAAPSQSEPLDCTIEDKNTADSFGDFDAAPSLVAKSGYCEDVAFGEFDAAPSFRSGPFPDSHEDKDDGEYDAFGDFDAAPPLQPEPLQNANEDKDEVDGFGDFDATPSLVAQSDDGEGDALGDFDAAPSLPEPLQNTSEDEDAVYGFGDFDAAPSLVVQSDDGEGDAFGDFDAAPSQPEPLQNASEDKEADNNFGSFGATPSLVAQSDDGENDTFGNFNAAPETLDSKSENKDVDDDFGDFDAAPTLEPQSDDDKDDDKDDAFGDFDDPPPKTEPLGSTSENKDVAEDFGDFDEAQEPSSPSRSDQNFCTFDTEPAHDISLPPTGTVTHGKRNLFAKMQSRYTFLDSDRPGDVSDDNSVGKEGLAEFLASTKPVRVNSGFREDDGVYRVLRDAVIQTKAGNLTSFMKNDGQGPYDCFVYPLIGFRAPIRELANERLLRRHSSTRAIPDVLPIRLPSGKETSLETASPVTSRDRKMISNNSTTTSPIPNLNVPKGDGASRYKTGSEDVQTFPLKIPDLSFMLQSQLKLPAN